jgi:hydroxyacylglutathione hydrolase
MIIKKIPTGMFNSNSYIAGANGEGAVIDAGVRETKIIEIASAEGLKIKYIILTHVHIDHIAYIDELKAATGAITVAHRKDAPHMRDAWRNGAKLFGKNNVFDPIDLEVDDGESITVGGIVFKFIHTPGHTSGGMCILAEDNLFTGDTIFYMSIGNTSLGDGNEDVIRRSISEKIMTLPPETRIFPGHGKASTVKFEKENNPYI